MATVTLTQLQSKGFSIVANGSDRIQRWSGAFNGESVEVLWDSTAQKAYRIPPMDDSVALFRALLTLGISVSALTTASTLGAGVKSDIQAALAAALQDISLP